MTHRRIPLNLFGTSFGIAGLGSAWLAMGEFDHAPKAIGYSLIALAAVVWLTVLIAYLRYAIPARALGRDLADPIAAPFSSLALIVPMIVAAEGVYPHAPAAGRVIFDVFLVLTVVLGGWLAGHWIITDIEHDQVHPGYFLPTVAGGLIAAYGAALVGQHTLGEMMFGLGMINWIVLGPVIMGRLLVRPVVPAPLLPTYAIEVAPPAVATFAYLALNGSHIDTFVAYLGGFGLLMIIVQIRLLPSYLRLRFAPSTWAFAFSWSAVTIATVEWLQVKQPAGYATWQYLALAALSLLIGSIGARTLLALKRGNLLPVGNAAPAQQELRESTLQATS